MQYIHYWKHSAPIISYPRLVLLMAMLFSLSCFAQSQEEQNPSIPQDKDGVKLNDSYGQLLLIQGGITATIFGYGYLTWGYKDVGTRFSTTDDGWFTKSSDNAGMDKLGHVFATKVFSDLSSNVFQNYFGFSSNASIWSGAIVSWNSMFFLEVMDGALVRWGFSYGDVIANTAGAAMSVIMQSYPNIASKVDFRLEHNKLFDGRFDQITLAGDDYNDMKFLLVTKLAGFDVFNDSFMRFLEFNVGYYSRDKGEKTINMFVGIGFNFAELFNTFSYPKVGKVFNYVQIPFTHTNIYNKSL